MYSQEGWHEYDADLFESLPISPWIASATDRNIHHVLVCITLFGAYSLLVCAFILFNCVTHSKYKIQWDLRQYFCYFIHHGLHLCRNKRYDHTPFKKRIYHRQLFIYVIINRRHKISLTQFRIPAHSLPLNIGHITMSKQKKDLAMFVLSGSRRRDTYLFIVRTTK